MMEDEKVQVTILTVGPPEEDVCIERINQKLCEGNITQNLPEIKI